MRAIKLLKPNLKLVFLFVALTGLLITGLDLVATASKRSTTAGSASRTLPRANGASFAQSHTLAAYSKLPLNFEPNQGQANSNVKYLAHGRGYTLFLTPSEAVLSVRQEGISQRTAAPRQHGATFEAGISNYPHEPSHRNSQFVTLRIGLKGANALARVSGLDELPGKSNYLIGKDPSHWHTQIPTYSQVKYENVYPGIDVVYHGSQGQLEYDFIVAPGGNPRSIRLSMEPAGSVHLDASGSMVSKIGASEIRQRPPRIYQTIGGAEKEIAGHYVLVSKGEIAFEIDPYDGTKPLVIDPALDYWTYLGGAAVGGENGNAIAVDASGNAYIAGLVQAVDFPVTSGVFQATVGDTNCQQQFTSCGDAFVTKLNAAGTAEIYSTFLGGNARDQANAIAVDSAGNAYVTGLTYSTNFPVSAGAFRSASGGGNCPVGGSPAPCSDAFVTVLNSTGTALVYSSYLGGSGADQGNGIAVDPSGKVFVTGSAGAVDFPTTPGAFKTTFGSGSAVFVSQINPSVSGIPSLVYSTFLGGENNTAGFASTDSGNGIAVDSTSHAYVTGITFAPNFATSGTFQPMQPEVGSAFVAKLNPLGTGLAYATYLGGSAAGCFVNDVGNAIAVDSAGNAYVGGFASSHDFPATPGAFQQTVKGSVNGFVSKLNPNGTALVYSTLLGGSFQSSDCGAIPVEGVRGLVIDSTGDAYVTGSANSADFPVTPDALEPDCPLPVVSDDTCLSSEQSSSFATVVNPQGTSLVFSTFINDATSIAIAKDSSGDIYLTGSSFAVFPSVPGFSNVGNSFVAKIAPTGLGPTAGLSPRFLIFPSQGVGTASAAQPVTLRNGGNAPLTISSIAVSGVFTQTNNCGSSLPAASSCTINVVFTPAETGVTTGTLTIADSAVDSPHVLQVKGTGGTASVSLSASSLTFASQGVGVTTAAQTITVTNSGGANLPITTIATTGDFAQTNNCGSSLAAGGSCAINVTFTPTVSGPRSGTLAITDGASNSPQTVLLGGGLQVSADPASATVSAGQSASYSLTISPAAGSQSASLSCSGAPAGAQCTVPSSVNFNGAANATAMVSVTTTARSMLLPRLVGRWFFFGQDKILLASIALFLLVWLMRCMRLQRRFGLMGTVGLATIVALMCTSCGGGNSSSGGGGNSGTPVGTYHLMVTASSGSATSNATLTLIVQ